MSEVKTSDELRRLWDRAVTACESQMELISATLDASDAIYDYANEFARLNPLKPECTRTDTPYSWIMAKTAFECSLLQAVYVKFHPEMDGEARVKLKPELLKWIDSFPLDVDSLHKHFHDDYDETMANHKHSCPGCDPPVRYEVDERFKYPPEAVAAITSQSEMESQNGTSQNGTEGEGAGGLLGPSEPI